MSLFLAGISCLLLEVFVLPGFGIFGLGGGAMVLASLILASQTFIWPRNEYQFDQLERSLLTIADRGRRDWWWWPIFSASGCRARGCWGA